MNTFRLQALNSYEYGSAIEILTDGANPRHVVISDRLTVLNVFPQSNRIYFVAFGKSTAKSGYLCRLDAETGEITARTASKVGAGRAFFDDESDELVAVSETTIDVLDRTTLALKGNYDLGRQVSADRWTLANRATLTESEGEWWQIPDRVRGGDSTLVHLDLDTRLMVRREDGLYLVPRIVAPQYKKLAYDLIDLKAESLTRRVFFSTSRPVYLRTEIRATSPNGRYILVDHFDFIAGPEETTEPRLASIVKSILGKENPVQEGKVPPGKVAFGLELWNLESGEMEKVLTTGTFGLNDLPTHSSIRAYASFWASRRKYTPIPSDVIIRASKRFLPQFIETLDWPTKAFNEALARQCKGPPTEELKFLSLCGEPVYYCALAAYLAQHKPDMLSAWDLITLNKEQENNYRALFYNAEFFLRYNMSVCWGKQDDRFMVLFRNGAMREVSLEGELGPIVKPHALPPIDSNYKWHNVGNGATLTYDGPQRYRIRYAFGDVAVTVPPFEVADDDEIRELPESASEILEDKEIWKRSIEQANRVVRKLRPANISIKSRKPEAIIEGLQKMAAVVRERYDDVVFGSRWSPTLFVQGERMTESEFCDILVDAGCKEATPALSDLVDTLLSHQQGLFDVWDDETNAQSLMHSVVSLILLNKEVTQTAFRWVTFRDQDHDEIFPVLLEEKIIPAIGLRAPGMDRLVTRIAVQNFSAALWFGMLLRDDVVPKLEQMLYDDVITPESLARLIADEAEDQRNRLSWASEVGLHGLLVAIAGQCNPMREKATALAAALRQEAQRFPEVAKDA